MVSQLNTLTFSGVNIVDVQVQTLLSPGIPNFTVVGLPDKVIAESKERVRAALNSIALDLPAKKIIINLSPADLLKEGSHFDLAIAACLLIAVGVLPESELSKYMVLGELGLDGSILPVNGVLPAAIGAAAKDLGLICPEGNGHEAAWSNNELILAPKHLLSLINHFKGIQVLSKPTVQISNDQIKYSDLKDVIGQESAKRALEIAAVGNHNMLMIGTPGSGKSMLASRLPGILPPMSPKEILETSMVYSIAGEIKNGVLKQQRPFRSPHQSSSMVAIVGGGHSKKIMPGEISLAHNGVLFLDEFPEFPRAVIESIRQPLETKHINVARANTHVTFPAKFQLIAAMNHCRCGYFKDPNKACARVARCSLEYQNKISAPILDRIDICIEVNQVNKYDYSSMEGNASSYDISQRVLAVRNAQEERYRAYGITTNSELEGELLFKFASPDKPGEALLNTFAEKYQISMRGYNKILKLARSIADMAGATVVNKFHIAEALSYRSIS